MSTKTMTLPRTRPVTVRCNGSGLTAVSSVLTVAALTLAATVAAPAQAPGAAADRAVLAVMTRAADLPNAAVWHRERVSDDTDIVLVGAQQKTFRFEHDGAMWWGPGEKLGLFVQEAAPPFRVYTLTIESDLPDCVARLLRVALTDAVASCAGDKRQVSNHKFLYDTRAKRFVGRYTYDPYHVADATAASAVNPPRVRLVARNASREARIQFVPAATPAFSVASVRAMSAEQMAAAWSPPALPGSEGFGPSLSYRLVTEPSDDGGGGDRLLVESRIDGKTQRYRLPQTSYKDLEAVRPGEGTPEGISEKIGPTQVVNDVLWFGKTFYNGEGLSGVGGFGYFDPTDRQFHIFSGPEIADWSVAAMRVETDSVWLSLSNLGELGD